MVLVGALGVMLGALPTRGLDAQAAWSTRPALEGSYTQFRLDADGPTVSAGGVTGRVMWSAAGVLDAVPALAGRTDVGVYGTYAAAQATGANPGFSMYGAGAVADVRPFASPLAARLDPFLSLGAGVLHTNVGNGFPRPSSPLLAESRAAFTLTPGAGARVLLLPNVALQGDVRDVMTFRSGTRHNVAFGAGLRVTF
jgi:hypothetical protein